MRFEYAMKQLGGHSAGGQLIVHHNGANVLVGRHHDGQLIVAEDPLAQELVASIRKDGDGDHVAGGPTESVVKRPRRKKGEADPPMEPPADEAADEAADADADAADDETATHHDVTVADEVVMAEQLSG